MRPDFDAAFAAVAAFEREHLVGASERKSQGAWYTPPALARAVARLALGPRLAACRTADEVAALRVVDPASGAGALLLAALECLVERHLELDATPTACLARSVAATQWCLAAIDLDGRALDVAKGVFAALGGKCRVHRGDALSEPWPHSWDTPDVVVGNPPFGNLGKLRRGHPRLAALRERFGDVWQDKMDRAALFAVAVAHRADHWALVVPSALFRSDKGRRARQRLAEGGGLQLIDCGDAQLFADAAVTVGVLARSPIEGVEVAGWRAPEDADADEVLADLPNVVASVIEGEGTAPDGWFRERSIDAARWHVFGDATRERWAELDAVCVPLGERWHVGKGMETGANRAFVVPPELAAGIGEGPFVRRRVRGRDIATLGWTPRDEWLCFSPAVASFDELPAALRSHLECSRPRLEARAACTRGDCAWWQWTWPLHHAWLERCWRVVVPYRAPTLRAAVLPPRTPVGLTDTTQVFVDTEAEAWALAGWLCSARIRDRFRGLTKPTGAGMVECFENQVREVPVPVAARWQATMPELAAAARHGDLPQLDQIVGRT